MKPRAGSAQLAASLVDAGKISGTAAKEVLRRDVRDRRRPGGDRCRTRPRHNRGRRRSRRGRAESSRRTTPRPSPTTDAGKTGAINALVGQVMKETRGRANAARGPGAPAAGGAGLGSRMRTARLVDRKGSHIIRQSHALAAQRQLHQVVLLRHAHQALAGAGAHRRRDHGPRLRLHPARGLRQLHLPRLGLLPDPAVPAPLRPRRALHRRRDRRSSCSASGS